MPRGVRRADAEIGARSSRLDAGLRQARNKFRRFGKDTSRDLSRSFSGIKRDLGTIAGFGGIAVFGQMARGAYQFEKKLFRLGVQGNKSSEWMARMRKQTRQVSNETGVAAEELLAGAEAYTTLTGKADEAAQSMVTFARVAQASGSEMNDIAQTAAALRDNFGLDPKEFEQAFSGLLTQGKAGAVELKELSGLAAELAAQFPDFGKTGLKGLAEMGAMLQVGRKAFGSSKEAATGFTGAMGALATNAKKFRQAGVKLFDKGPGGVKKFRGLAQIFEDISNSKLAKDPELLSAAFGRKEGLRFYQAWQKNKDLFNELNEAALTSSEVAQDFAKYQNSEFGKMDRAWQKMKNSIAEVFTPQRIEKFAAAMSKLADVVAFIADHLVEIGAALAVHKGLTFGAGMLGGAGAGGAGGGVGVPMPGGGAGAGGAGGAGGKRRGKKGRQEYLVSGKGYAAKGAPKVTNAQKAGDALGRFANATMIIGTAYLGGKALEEFAEREKKSEEKQSATQAGFDQVTKMLMHSLRTKGMSPETMAIASQLLKEGMAQGFINNQGNISSVPASQGAGAQAYRENRSSIGKAADAAAGTTQTQIALERRRIGEENRQALELALALAGKQALQPPQKVEFTVKVDQQGLIKAEETGQRKKRAKGAR